MSKFTTRTVTSTKKNAAGEVTESVERVEIVKNELEPFFLTYSKQIMALCGKSIFNSTVKVLWKLLEFAEYNTGKVYMNANRVKEIMDVCGIGRATYTRAIVDLVEEGIIEKDGTTFTIDENMFWKGDRETREQVKRARLKVSFSAEYSAEDGLSLPDDESF